MGGGVDTSANYDGPAQTQPIITKKQKKNSKHTAFIQPNGAAEFDQILELIDKMERVTIGTENLRKHFNQTWKLK